MKQVFLVICLFLVASPLFAQELSKAEKKALKAEIKAFQKDPARYKAFKEGLEQKRDKIQELDAQVGDLDKSVNEVQTKIDEKDRKIKELGDELARRELEKKEMENAIKSQTNTEGLVYKVLVEISDEALYKEVDPLTGNTKPVFGGEIVNGTRSYVLGYFKDRQEAETFKNYLQLLRVKVAKVVAFRDGQMVNQ